MRFQNVFLFVLAIAIIFSCKKKTNNGGSSTPRPNPTPVWDPNALRGVWVTNVASTALDSRNNIQTCVNTCKAANINNIFVVVYNGGRTLYPSTVMQNLIGKPIMERFAGRDPLQEMIEEAHAKGIKVHAWFEYGFSSSYSQSGGDIIAAKPNWAARDVTGNLVVKNGFDWLNAFDPQVQNFMIDLFKEVVTRYNVDGVQGDDRLPALPTSAGYDTYTQNLYLSEMGSLPPGNPADAGWINWRAKKLNTFLKNLRSQVKAIKPNCQLTMSPSPYPWGLNEYLQDWPTWVDSGWVDAILPQCYRYNANDYKNTIIQQRGYYRNTNVPFYPGVLVKVGSTLQSDALLTEFIKENRRNNFKGECFFFYEGIKDKLPFFQGQYPFIQ